VQHAAPGLARLAARLRGMLRPTGAAAARGAEAIVVTHAHAEYRAVAAGATVPVIDLVRLWHDLGDQPDTIRGIGW
jgi:GDP-mannose 6-dehydrogenase